MVFRVFAIPILLIKSAKKPINTTGKIKLSAETVATHKYIKRRGKRVGYYSGFSLANRMGLSTQVPYTVEITSNYAPAQVRELIIKNRKYIIRRPVVEVTDDNVTVLQFLDCLKDIEKCAEEDMVVCGRILSEYAKRNAITKKRVDDLIENLKLNNYKAEALHGDIKQAQR